MSNRPDQRWRVIALQTGVHFEPLHKSCRAAVVARNHEDGVVAGNRADGFGKLGPVDRQRERLRLARAGAQHDELLHAIDASESSAAARSSALSVSSGLGRSVSER